MTTYGIVQEDRESGGKTRRAHAGRMQDAE